MFVVLGISHDGQLLCMVSTDDQKCIQLCRTLRNDESAEYIDYNVYEVTDGIDLRFENKKLIF